MRQGWPGKRAATAIMVAGIIGSSSAGNDNGAIREQLLARLSSDELTSRSQVSEFYASRDWIPVWTIDQPASALIHSVLHYLDGVRAEGLEPGGFHTDELTALAHLHDRRLSPDDLARRDLLLTDAVFTLGRQFAGAHIDPGALYEKWSTPSRDTDFVAPLTAALDGGRGLFETLDALRPDDPGYSGLRESLARYRTWEAAGGWVTLSAGPALHPGDTGPRVTALCARLAAEGYAGALGSDSFDNALARAVSVFQTRHGLVSDGVVGPATRAALDVPARARVAQIAVNLARLRWLPHDPGDRHIRINIPEFKLEVVEDGETKLCMRAVVGRADRPTPILSGKVTYLEVNPYWNIPQKIARHDVLPLVRSDPGYLSAHNIRVYENWRPEARELEPHAVDWEGIGERGLAYRLRQEPGPLNALGRVKFMFANPYSVYIHDTPNREKFTSRRRCYSSGCVRVESPLTLASYLLRGDDSPGDDLMAAVDSLENAKLGLPESVPVHLVYFTAWVDREGVTHFRDDVYGYDEVLSDVLAAR